MSSTWLLPRWTHAFAVVFFPLFSFSLAAQSPGYKVLVFSATAGFRHDSISNGIATIQMLAATNNFTVDATENPTLFTDANLAQYKAIVFLNTTGDVLDTNQQSAMERFVRAGGGWVGIHA